MTRTRSSPIGLYVRFLALAGVVSAGVVAVGYWPTVRLGGSEAVVGMLAGCGISLAASMLGAVPLVLVASAPGGNVPQAALMATLVRFMVVLMLALSAAMSGWFERSSLLIWVAISYLVFLMADTLFALRLSGSGQESKK